MRIGYHSLTGPCGPIRVEWPAKALRSEGYDIVGESSARMVYRNPFDEVATWIEPPPWVEIVDVETDVDVYVIQRPTHRQWLDVIPMLQAKGVRVVVEMDDCFDRIARQNKAFFVAEPHWVSDDELAAWNAHDIHPVIKKRKRDGTSEIPGWNYCPDVESSNHRLNTRRAIALADHLVVSTPALAKHYSMAKSVSVVANCIPEHYLHRAARRTEASPLRIGWTGSVHAHPNDLQVMGDALRRLSPHHFVLIGDETEEVEKRIGRKVNGKSGWVSLEQYPNAYAECDIAVCPLEPTTFNDCKSALKAIEAASLGVIPVMSASAEYLELHRHGVGLIARTPTEWAQHLNDLLASPARRQALRAKGLEAARTMTVEANAHRWLEAWTGQTDVPKKAIPQRRSGLTADVTVAIPSIPPRAEMLRHALESVHGQTLPAVGIALAVDHNREGAWTTRNRVARMSQTTWTAFLDDDDRLLPHHLEHLVGCAQDHNADLVWGWFDVVAPLGIQGGHGRDPWPQNRGRQYDPADPHVVPITYVVRTELLHDALTKMGGFQPDEAGAWEDQDQPLFDTMIELGAKTFASTETTWRWFHHRLNTSGLPSRW